MRKESQTKKEYETDIPQGLALLKRLLDDAPRLKRLTYNHKKAELTTWDNNVKRIITETFGRNSKEYVRYDGIFSLKYVETQADKELAYIDHISQREKALRDIIQEYDLSTNNNKLEKTSLKFPWLSLKPNIHGVGVDLKKVPLLKKWFG